MRRRAVSIAAIGAIAIAVAIAIGSSSGGRYQVAAIFDTAKGMVAGQQVKIAGAVVGRVDSVHLAPGPKARIVMSIDHRFASFRADATCSILPEGLISENFVECSPGHAAARLAAAADGVPTVPLGQTTIPYSLQDVLGVLSLPTDQRLSLLVSQLGIGTAGEGGNLNALLRRANPALQASQRVFEIVDAQRDELASAVAQTDQVIGSLARRSSQVRAFVDEAANVAQTTAQHRDALGQAIQRLPGMLAAVRPGLESLDRAARNATPLLAELRRSAPELARLNTTLPTFARAGIPALQTLASAAARGRSAVHDAIPVVTRLNAVTGPLKTLGTGLDQLLVSTRDEGGFDGALKMIFAIATATSLEDASSHTFAAFANVEPQCIAAQLATLSLAGCSHKYDQPGHGLVPINEPSCGVRDFAWWTARCPAPLPLGAGTLLSGLLSGATPARDPELASDVTRLNGLINQAIAGGNPSRSEARGLVEALLKGSAAKPVQQTTTPSSPAQIRTPTKPSAGSGGTATSSTTPGGSASPAPPSALAALIDGLAGSNSQPQAALQHLLGYLLK